jgi:hypothetical protein
MKGRRIRAETPNLPVLSVQGGTFPTNALPTMKLVLQKKGGRKRRR